jgi:ABC-type nitrate/sulfonate/bicarbonate transport system substrate-binding protein
MIFLPRSISRGVRIAAFAMTTMFAGLAIAIPGASAASLRVGISQPAYSFVPLDVAIQAGKCKAHGLDIEKLVFNGSAHMHQAIAADSVDIGLGAGPEFGFLIKGAPEKAIAAMADAPQDLALVVLKDGGINTIADLKGKRVSMSTRGSLTEWAGRSLSRKQGWGNDGMSLVPLGSFGAQVAALKTHQIDGMIVEAGTAGRLDEEGTGKTLVRFGDIVSDFHIHVIFATDGIIKSRPQDVKAFLACWFDGIKYMDEHRPESIKIAAEVLSMSEALSGKLYDLLMPYYNKTGRFNAAAMKVIGESMVEMGTFDKAPDLAKVYTESFLPDAK